MSELDNIRRALLDPNVWKRLDEIEAQLPDELRTLNDIDTGELAKIAEMCARLALIYGGVAEACERSKRCDG